MHIIGTKRLTSSYSITICSKCKSEIGKRLTHSCKVTESASNTEQSLTSFVTEKQGKKPFRKKKLTP